MKKKYTDVTDNLPSDNCLGVGVVYMAGNNLLVLHNNLTGSLAAVKGKKLYKRQFDKPISAAWMKRRVNEFALHVKPPPKPKMVNAETSKAEKKSIKAKAAGRVAKKKKVAAKKGIRLKKTRAGASEFA